MSACCAVLPNSALNTALTQKSESFSGDDIQHAVVAFESIVPAMPIVARSDVEEVTFSPPRFPNSGSIQVLRI